MVHGGLSLSCQACDKRATCPGCRLPSPSQMGEGSQALAGRTASYVSKGHIVSLGDM